MEIKSIKEELNSLAYHGRGIMIGKSADGKKGCYGLFHYGQKREQQKPCVR